MPHFADCPHENYGLCTCNTPCELRAVIFAAIRKHEGKPITWREKIMLWAWDNPVVMFRPGHGTVTHL